MSWIDTLRLSLLLMLLAGLTGFSYEWGLREWLRCQAMREREATADPSLVVASPRAPDGGA